LPFQLEVGRIRELSESQRHSEALAAAEALALEAPEDRDALYLIAANQRCLGRMPEALETLQRLERQHPGFSLLHQERGYCYTTLRDAPRAIDAFLQAVNLNPALAASWSMLEKLYRMTGDARNAAMAAVNHVPVLIDQQKYPQARPAIDALLKVEPGNKDFLSLSAATWAGWGDTTRRSRCIARSWWRRRSPPSFILLSATPFGAWDGRRRRSRRTGPLRP